MTLEIWLTYVAMVAIIAISPGPSVLLASSHGMRHGYSKTLATIAGDLSANTLQMTAVALGLGAALAASATFFGILKWAGVGYLMYLGIRQWIVRPDDADTRSGDTRGQAAARTTLYWQGFTVSASNPKAVLFFLALFPQFLVPASPRAMQLVVLGLTFLAMDGIALILYARFGARLRAWLVINNRVRWQGRISGSMLLVAAAYLSRTKRLVAEAAP